MCIELQPNCSFVVVKIPHNFFYKGTEQLSVDAATVVFSVLKGLLLFAQFIALAPPLLFLVTQ